MTYLCTILHGLVFVLLAVPAFADGPVPLDPAPKEPPGIPFIIETAVLGPFIIGGDMGDVLTAFDGARPMGPFTWGNPDTYWCGVDLDCGGGDQDQPAPVPLPAGVWLLIAAIAALILKGRKL